MVENPRILVVEDDPMLGPSLLQRLRLEGFAPTLAPTGEAALKELRRNPPLAVVSDIRLPDMSGEDLFYQMLDITGLLPAYFVTAFGEIDQAVRLIKAGAREYLTKPVDTDVLVELLTNAAAGDDTAFRASPLSAPRGVSDPTEQSPAMREAARTLEKFALTDMPVLLTGETGVGKEVTARRLHALSRPEGAPFIAVNCAAIPADLLESTIFGHEKGAFTGATARKVGLAEEAASGTLFLDEVAELPPDLQAKLLRLIQEGTFLPLGAAAEERFTGRIVAATHADLEARIGEGLFREDLYYRINVLALALPPLRERSGDIPALAAVLLDEANARTQVPPKRLAAGSLPALQAYSWPGNVRELRNRIQRAVVMTDGESIGPDDLFPEGVVRTGRRLEAQHDHVQEAGERQADEQLADDQPAGEPLQDAAQKAIRERGLAALEKTGGNQSKAARLLGVSRTTIWKYAR